MTIRAEYEQRCQIPSDIYQHLPRLHDEAAKGDITVIELGVRSGNSTAAFLCAVEEHGGHVWSVDTDPTYVFADHPQWTFIQGDDLDVAVYLPDGVDLVFIDTTHYYQQTWAELETYVPKVRPGGVVALHDTELETPHLASSLDPPFPVRVAVDEYCAEHDLHAEHVTGCYGLALIRIPS